MGLANQNSPGQLTHLIVIPSKGMAPVRSYAQVLSAQLPSPNYVGLSLVSTSGQDRHLADAYNA